MDKPQEITFSDEDFLLAENRHEELIRELKKIVYTLNEFNEENISEKNLDYNKLLTTFEAISDKSQNETVILLNGIRDDIIESNEKLITSLENRLLPDSFSLVRNNYGHVQEVKVNYKSANKIK
jgi:hypothetical protein